MAEVDRRLMRVSIQIGNQVRTYDNLAITAKGTKFTNANQGEATVTIANLEKSVRDQILTNTSPFSNRTVRSSVLVEAGRESYGLSTVYEGDIYRSSVSQAPDNILSLKCLTGQFLKGTVVSRNADPITPLSRIAQQIADDNGLTLQFLAQDKNISNFQYNGSAAGQISVLQELADGEVYVDGQVLVVKETNAPIPGGARRVARDSGMVGIPEFTEQGLKVAFLYDPATRLGGQIEIDSIQYPATNGRYVIYKLEFDLANRDTPFYYAAEARPA